MRRVQCEGGPKDGETVQIVNDTTSFYVLVRSRYPYILNSIFMNPMRKGVYRQDPLDSATFIWCGE
jgi:hypothetical protein